MKEQLLGGQITLSEALMIFIMLIGRQLMMGQLHFCIYSCFVVYLLLGSIHHIPRETVAQRLLFFFFLILTTRIT